MNRKIISALLICAAFFAISCQKTFKVQTYTEPAVQNQPLETAQKQAVEQEKQSIDLFIKRTGWNMTETPTGLRYEIYRPSRKGMPKVEYGDAVKLSYSLKLLNGTEIENFTPDAPRTYIIGTSPLIPGLLEALLLLKKGDGARIIIPSHLAYGFSGNGETVPPQATLLYDVHVEEILVSQKK